MKSLLAAFSLALIAGCTTRVNLAQVRNSFDRHKGVIQTAENSIAQRSGEEAEILGHTSTPKVAPYPSLKLQIEVMRNEVAGMKLVDKKIEAFKSTFDQYRQGRNEVSQDNPEEWNRFQSVMAENQVLEGEMQGHAGRFNAANQQFASLVKQHGIAKIDIEGVRAEIQTISGEVSGGMEEIERTIIEKKKMLSFAREAGASAQLILDKREVLDKMETLIPEMWKLNRAVADTKVAALRDFKGKGEFWTGPGMARSAESLDEFRQLQGKYRKQRSAWDKLYAEFEAIKPPQAAVPQSTTGTAAAK